MAFSAASRDEIRLISSLSVGLKFSIVVPVRNCEGTIERAISSILSQGWPDLELILVDGASDDRTVEIASRQRKHFTHFISEKDRGQTHAINKGFSLATGDVVNWLCGDDEFAKGALQRVAQIVGADGDFNMVIGGSCRFYGAVKQEVYLPRSDALDRIGYFNGIEQPACFWSGALHRKAGELNEMFHYAMDWDWWNRLKIAGARAAILPEVLANYYFSESNKTSSSPKGNLEESYEIIRQYGPLGGRLADIYMYLLERYDLAGCYDQPPVAPKDVMKEFWSDLSELKDIFGEEIIYSYNWNWISKQLRGKQWF
jgi:glycosyltransferase involved in cell wall biosynthesis